MIASVFDGVDLLLLVTVVFVMYRFIWVPWERRVERKRECRLALVEGIREVYRQKGWL